MSAEIIDGTAREVEPESRALAVVAPEPRGLAVPETPGGMIALATQMATALADIVDRQRLYTVIQGRKYPQVEAWMTIGRMDNVVAREAEHPIRHDDGSYEAFVELIRLSDGMVIGRASALCGTPDDRPWSTRGEPQRRSMAATRATSRAFRQQYSWIMSLAGYEPTPADEMPADLHDGPQQPTSATQRAAAPQPGPEHLTGTVAVGKPPVDCELRQTPDGAVCGFSLVLARGKVQVLAEDELAEDVAARVKAAVGAAVNVWGRIEAVAWEKDGKPMPPYRRLHLERIEWTGVADADAELEGLQW